MGANVRHFVVYDVARVGAESIHTSIGTAVQNRDGSISVNLGPVTSPDRKLRLVEIPDAIKPPALSRPATVGSCETCGCRRCICGLSRRDK